VGVALLAGGGALFAIARQGSTASPSALPASVAPASTGPVAVASAWTTPAPTPHATSGGVSSWITFQSPGGGFTAIFPAQPKETSETTKTAVGDAPVSVWSYIESAHLALFAGIAKYPAGSMTGVGASAIYDGAVTGMATSSSQTVDSQGPCDRDGHAGREFTLTSKQYNTKGQIYLIGDNMYMVYVVYDTGADSSKLQAFLATFHITV
jgi:hypothetical protein